MSTLAVNAVQNLSGGHSITGMGKILQVQSATKSDTFSIATTMNGTAGFSDITGMTVNITPSSTSSKIMVWAISRVSCPNHANTRLVRGSTGIAIGDADGNRTRTSTGEQYNCGDSYMSQDSPIMYLDSPSSTSTLTYKLQIACASTAYFNRIENDSNALNYSRPACTITVMEVAA